MVIPHSALAHSPLPPPLLLLPQSVEESPTLVLDGPGVCPLPLEDVLPRPLPRPLVTTPLRATASVAGSDDSCLAGVCVGAVVARVLTICEIE